MVRDIGKANASGVGASMEASGKAGVIGRGAITPAAIWDATTVTGATGAGFAVAWLRLNGSDHQGKAARPKAVKADTNHKALLREGARSATGMSTLNVPCIQSDTRPWETGAATATRCDLESSGRSRSRSILLMTLIEDLLQRADGYSTADAPAAAGWVEHRLWQKGNGLPYATRPPLRSRRPYRPRPDVHAVA